MLITSLFPDTPRAANALISYNNRGVGEAVPFFEELIVPLFSDVDRNGSELMKAMIEVAREQYNGAYIRYILCKVVSSRQNNCLTSSLLPTCILIISFYQQIKQ